MIEPTVERAIESSGLPRFTPVLANDFLAEHDSLRAAVDTGGTEPWLAAAARSLLATVPIPPTYLGFDRSSFFRPPFHRRSFYYSPRPPHSGADQPTHEVIAIKGAEPLAPDSEQQLADLRQHLLPPELLTTQRRAAEHFALFEDKVPGALTLAEALGEARIAARLQEQHLAVYGTLARLPLPLAVHRLPDEAVVAMRGRLQRHLSRRALLHLEPGLAAGLAVYVYRYPHLPIRVAHLEPAGPTSFRERLARIEERVDLEPVIQGWIELFARLLHLGYLPASLASRGRGACCDGNNAVIDGGFVDLDSLVPVAEMSSDVELQETLHHGVVTLIATVRAFLVSRDLPRDWYAELPSGWIARYVQEGCRLALETEARASTRLDPRVSEYFATPLKFAAVMARLGEYFPRF